jgi:hypothetical protein
MLISELAALCGISRQWLNKLIDAGEVAGVRRKGNGRLEIFNEDAALFSAPVIALSQKMKKRKRDYNRDASTLIPRIEHSNAPENIEKALLQMTELEIFDRAVRDAKRQGVRSLEEAKSKLSDPDDFEFAADFLRIKKWMANGRTVESRLARLSLISFKESPGEEQVEAMENIARRVTKSRFGKSGSGDKHGSIARIARNFGITRQALWQAWNRWPQKSAMRPGALAEMSDERRKDLERYIRS